MAEKRMAKDGKQPEKSNYLPMDKKHFEGTVPKPPLGYNFQLKRVTSEPLFDKKPSAPSLKTQISVGNIKYELDSYSIVPKVEQRNEYLGMDPVSEAQATTSKSEDHSRGLTPTDRQSTISSSVELPDYENFDTFTETRASASKTGDHKPVLKSAIKKQTLKASVPVVWHQSGSASTKEYQNVKDNDDDGIYYNKTNDLKDK